MIDGLPTLTSANANMIRVWNQPHSPGEQARLHLRSTARQRISGGDRCYSNVKCVKDFL